MKKLITTGITGDVGAPFTAPSLDNLQANFGEIPDAIIKGLLGSYTTNDVIVLYGVVITLSTVTTSNDTATWTAGAIYYNGEVYQVSAGTLTKTSGVFLYSIVDTITNETFDDGNSYPWIEVRTITIASGTSGSGIADYGASTVKALNEIVLSGLSLHSSSNLSSIVLGPSIIRRRGNILDYSVQVTALVVAGTTACSVSIDCPLTLQMKASQQSGGVSLLIGTNNFNRNGTVVTSIADGGSAVNSYIDSNNRLVLEDTDTANITSGGGFTFTATVSGYIL